MCRPLLLSNFTKKKLGVDRVGQSQILIENKDYSAHYLSTYSRAERITEGIAYPD